MNRSRPAFIVFLLILMLNSAFGAPTTGVQSTKNKATVVQQESAKETKIQGIRFTENQIIFDIDGNMPEKLVTYDPAGRILFIEFTKTNFTEKSKKIKIFGDCIEKIETVSFEGNVDFFITLKKDMEYKEMILSNPARYVIEFKKAEEVKKFTVVIDPGHGGKDPGAIGYNGIKEKDIVLTVSKLIKAKLENDFNTIITRDDDFFIELAERAEIGNRAKADLFVSIHANAINKSSTKGIEVFYYSKKESAYAKAIAAFENSVDEKFGVNTSYTDFIVSDIFYHINQEKSAKLSSVVLEDLLKNTDGVRRGTFGANFAVLRGSKSPAILIELGFVTNPEEALKLTDPEYQEKLADAIYRSIKKYFE